MRLLLKVDRHFSAIQSVSFSRIIQNENEAMDNLWKKVILDKKDNINTKYAIFHNNDIM